MYGSQFLHKSMDCGQTWEIISPDLTTNDKEKQALSKKTGGLTYDQTGAENFTTILAIAPSPVDQNVIWVGTDDGNVQLTRDGGKNWTNLADRIKGMPKGSWVPQIEVSTKNAGEAFVVVNDYRRNNWEPMVFHTADYGQTFKRIVDAKQTSGYALCIVQDPVEPNLLFLGTDHGLWFSIDKGANWNKWTKGFPSVQVADLKIHPREHDLVIGTFGRSLWVLDDIRPIRALAQSKGEVLSKPLALFDAPEAYLAVYRSYDGYHFPTDAIFQGENARPGAMMTLWVGDQPKPQKKDMEQGEGGAARGMSAAGARPGGRGGREGKEVKILVFDMAGDTVRNYTSRVDTGMNRIYWDMRYDGARFPSRNPRQGGFGGFTPGGAEVLPGTYKVVVSLGDQKDSTMVTVNADPRLDIPMSDRKAKIAAYKEVYAMVETASKAVERIQAAQQTIKTVNEAMSNADKDKKKEIMEMGKALQDSLSAMEDYIFGKENIKGIKRSDETLNSYVFGMFRYIGASDGAPNQGAQRAMQFAKEKMSATLDRLNRLMENEFAAYKQKVEATDFSLFKEMKPIKME